MTTIKLTFSCESPDLSDVFAVLYASDLNVSDDGIEWDSPTPGDDKAPEIYLDSSREMKLAPTPEQIEAIKEAILDKLNDDDYLRDMVYECHDFTPTDENVLHNRAYLSSVL